MRLDELISAIPGAWRGYTTRPEPSKPAKVDSSAEAFDLVVNRFPEVLTQLLADRPDRYKLVGSTGAGT